jgi:hypothetical protein
MEGTRLGKKTALETISARLPLTDCRLPSAVEVSYGDS